ncbi:MAG: hypothetical protein DDT42_02113 [candidate division WS2 bacterium]|uniref:HNH nuclease domain-containing protein n=1 Tax=Psychracetigena formicireducens TaxID=2986056 RepID=A0A9E2F5I8_PSYF1|nr:hypothetical protein [Candidatus Psychracetigena formicireducens]
MKKKVRCQRCRTMYPAKNAPSYCLSPLCEGQLEPIKLVSFYAKDTPKTKKLQGSWEERAKRQKRNSQEYIDWRIAVFTRDELTCQHCGQQGGELSAHHIKPWATHPAHRYEVSNGQTLCLVCHRKLH